MLVVPFKPPPRIKKFVALSNYPSCNDCKYFENGTCKMFFSQNMAGEIVYAPAERIRSDKRFCGWEGKYFKPYLKK